MQIHLMSDLHLEFGSMETPAGGDILVLAGDILVAQHFKRGPDSPYAPIVESYDKFMNEAVERYGHVIMVMGNHEHYSGNFNDSARLIRGRYPGITLLDSDYIDIDSQRFFGGTMWTDINAHNPLTMMTAEGRMNDFKVIKKSTRKFRAQDSIVAHRQFMYYLDKYYMDGMIVISHHAPSYRSLDPKYAGDDLNALYASHLDTFILDRNIQAWFHGHLHNSSDYMIGNTRVLCNPRGYKGFELNKEFNPCFSL
jgi:Icc-related predicted phosphoesterase